MTAVELEDSIQQISSPSIVRWHKEGERQYDFELQGKKHNWNVSLHFPKNFPYQLPVAELRDKSFIGRIPHINKDGVICIEESDSMLIDYERPTAIIEFYLSDALRLLERVRLRIYQDELFDEYEGYFECRPKVNSFYHAQDNLEQVSLKIIYKENNRVEKHAIPALLYDKNSSLPLEFSNVSENNDLQVINIIHLPLLEPALPPANGEDISSNYLTSLQRNISDKNSVKLNKLLAKERSKNQFFILLSFPRSSGERSQLLLQFMAKQTLDHPLLSSDQRWSIRPHSIQRHNKGYLLERGGANSILTTKQVAIVGCGSVGSEVISLLAKTGIGEVIMVDDDALEADNIYRHRLGGRYLNFKPNPKSGVIRKVYKVSALADELRNNLPHIKFTAKPMQFEKAANEKDFLSSDLVIVAVGSPTTNLFINKKLKALGLHNVIFCWNEAAGYGGHSVALNLMQSCFECLYTNTVGFTLEGDLNLLKTSQKISRNLTGCAGVFTPFSNLDSTNTAILAAQQSLEFFLNGKHSVAMTWKGNGNYRLETTSRYDSVSLKDQVDLVKNKNCRVCNEQ
ncbi:hypothetical protein BCT30_02555 [Enterovibrio norvegicus]|uniref:ThiF family adenylyltransferase n=1 Tax=Enterovibrio norvegicus TaxID=188144 RepID=UPI000C833215|nr:ThiF family adenylyltransferase [Enterovibrio norvegicus]MCC4798348.1 ThiF family adenylyltransferase [Enterovibrio norvegicus]PMI33170.1 hypothetical protein BCU46_03580 [Enterovibrio norvegicus]PMN48280.1 hypothetical protein BCT30_02555 [Enterovibrio norvegicus]